MVPLWINKKHYYWVFCLNFRLEAKWDGSGGSTQFNKQAFGSEAANTEVTIFWIGLISVGLVPWASSLNHLHPRTQKWVEVEQEERDSPPSGNMDLCCAEVTPGGTAAWIINAPRESGDSHVVSKHWSEQLV